MFRLTLVYDNKAIQGFTGSWGFAVLIQTNYETLLFDTGWDGPLLLENLKKLKIDPASIRKLVLSHQHWDHIGGLPEIFQANPGLEVYVPASFSKNLKREIKKRATLIEIKEPAKISKGIMSTGELGNKVKEQALILDTGDGCYVLTGCAHPGLAAILNSASRYGRIKGILGGLHDNEEFERLRGMRIIAAGHCTAHIEKIKELFPKEFIEIEVGLCLDLR
ncbi:MAG: MBL fold metallo-hydrolase [Methanosarcina thermophila]|jgi:7,8-dihydropterin-6-yl-methyl-4-(beta-D-ribofuranosyl)aminobenzene 5'-phosphate synthase|uniref:7,8-dihydropterin-6-yl-methyl-4-(Beta-D-ribofuranosyl)aminobenzene 5'-phosphate synthase n=3 Tax=Methanosarcina thermophila TaxID=2210 RepID=A0A1I6X1L9_METTE|nr:MBL fold metallo-hydrolase [Methanosarcina thermophila]ALK04786.1 MAG: metallo-beta-lactamase [Methanosarcina sp. 795]AKB13496.1 7,8 dihydropteroate synthase (methanopterin) [Methanosarcina thermophila TM-1]AKB15868.1 7,8 dihydropteroate synthase (methanopterin) [Methanosarcina thermophila CHTI-55]NLU56573.1 MBL fold metallo-hydrolase [Methanosarcina thermophila]SFT32155.1 7,8-dihydropterin-6-yl-methyl-4-(beta-D-ribofuranosyl)aminobenzene 5'-phosphate synthase [Methanosarcina thermophila]